MAPLTPLTHAQLDFLTEQTERAARKAATREVKRYRNRALVGFALLFLGLGGSLYTQNQDADQARNAIVLSGRNVATDSCNARFRQQQVLRRIVRSGRPALRSYVKAGTITPEQGREALKQNTRQLNSLTLPDCRVVSQVITDDPNDLRPNQPPALYPGGPGSHTRPVKG